MEWLVCNVWKSTKRRKKKRKRCFLRGGDSGLRAALTPVFVLGTVWEEAAAVMLPCLIPRSAIHT